MPDTNRIDVMRYCLLTLGQAGVAEEGGAPVDFPAGKPLGILAYLALSQDPVPRDELAALFWADGDRSRARHSLRQALSFLRKRLGDDLFAEDDPVALDPSVLTSDIARLEDALEAGDVGAVLELYAGPFLETFQLPGSSAWHHWVERRRRILEERVAAFLRAEADRAGADGAESPERGTALLERIVRIEPHRIDHRVALVERLLSRGDLEAATAALAEARQADVDDPEGLNRMEEMVRAVREGRQAERIESDEVAPEFVGRTSELAALTAEWHAAVRGRRQIAVISGPTGIGKTRLAEELAVVAGVSGRAVHVKASPVERRLDWGVTAELARALYRLPGAAGVGGGADHVLRSLVPTLDGTAGPASGGPPRAVAVSDALCDLVSAVAYEAPLLIVLDDLQWVDRASLALLLRVARQVRDEPVMIVLTFRSEELGSRERTAIGALAEEENASRIRLHTLSRAEVEELLTLGLREPAARIERLAGRLHDVTHGHPLFLVELLRSLQDDGVLAVDADGWRLRESDPVKVELPASVRLVIHKRLEQLSEDARSVGAELAALPPSSGLERVRARTGLSDAAFTGALNELLERAVVSWDRSGRVEFTHDQLREAMAEKASRRGRWRWAAAAILLLALAAVGAVAVVAGEREPRWGGGTIVGLFGDTIGSVSPGPADGEWVHRSRTVWAPPGVQSFRLSPRVLTDGRLIWYGAVVGTLEAPEAVIHWGPDSTTVRHWPGDDNVKDVSPDGRHLLWVTQHRGQGQYAKELRVTRVGADSSHLLAGPVGMLDAEWSPDGTRIAVQLTLEQDSVLVLTPRGEPIWGREYYQAVLEGWCGPDRVMLVVREQPTARRRRVLVDLAGPTETVLDTAAIPGARCSPDGTAFVNRIVEAGVPRTVVTEMETGLREALPSPFAGAVRLHWLPDSTGPVPETLEAAVDTLQLARGSMTGLPSRVRMSDGGTRRAVARWRSLDPGIASVLADTTVAANRPGTTRLVGEFAGWLRDTVVVEVVEGEDAALVLADDFRSLDTLRWHVLGHPAAGTARVDGRTVLELRGDGRYSDGIISRTTAPAPAGLTVEMEIQAPQTQAELQDLAVWVEHAAPPTDTAAYDHHSAWLRGDNVGFSIPAFELEKWDPELVRLVSNIGTESVGRLPDGADLATWTHVAIQVQTDGLASLWIEREQVATLRVPTTLLREPLRVAIFGDVVGTHAYVRNFAWWAEPRYR